MTPERLERIKQLFEEVVSLDRTDQAAFLESACNGDRDLRVEVEQLLAADMIPDGLMEEPLMRGPLRLLSRGSLLGPYEIDDAIGAGGMGEVYRARDSRLNRTVAIKVMPGHLANDSSAQVRFQREAQAIARLNHAHICRLYDVGRQGDIDYLVMEYIEGETLAQHLGHERLTLTQSLRYATEIADALHEAHKHGIVHRDLKPSNVMLTTSAAKLLDFGIAQVLDSRAFSAGSLTSVTTVLEGARPVIGTLAYMSPEQLRGEELDARTDLFSLGAVIYEMATGEPAFTGAPAEVIDAVLNRDPPLLLNTALPERLQALIKKALEKNRRLRFQSAADLRDDFMNLLQFIEGEQRGASVKNALLIALGVLALLSVIMAVVVFLTLKA